MARDLRFRPTLARAVPRIRRLALFVLLLPVASGCYVISQAWHFNNLVNARRPVDQVESDPDTPGAIRAKLQHLDDILAYAQEQGLETGTVYRTYIPLDRPVVSYLVYAAEPFALKRKSWWFPITGRVPYLGYAAKKDRDEKASELKADGYDVYRSAAAAFSTLGWLDEPIFSSMLRRDTASLAHLIFHELTHRTVWVAGSAKFNENLAEYAARELTLSYLEARDRKKGRKRYVQKRRDRKRYSRWLKKLRKALRKLYKDGADAEEDVLAKRKEELFQRFTTPPEKPDFEAYDYIQRKTWNNATVLAASLYAPNLEAFERARACLGGPPLAPFLREVEREADEAEEPFAVLQRMCDKDP